MVVRLDINTIKTDLTEEELRIIYTFLISFFIGLLKPVKKSDLQNFINRMTVFDIKPYFNKIPKQIRLRISEIVRDNREMVKNILNGSLLIEQTKENRPDLYHTLNTHQGQIWSNRFMKYIQKLVFSL